MNINTLSSSNNNNFYPSATLSSSSSEDLQQGPIISMIQQVTLYQEYFDSLIKASICNQSGEALMAFNSQEPFNLSSSEHCKKINQLLDTPIQFSTRQTTLSTGILIKPIEVEFTLRELFEFMLSLKNSDGTPCVLEISLIGSHLNELFGDAAFRNAANHLPDNLISKELILEWLDQILQHREKAFLSDIDIRIILKSNTFIRVGDRIIEEDLSEYFLKQTISFIAKKVKNFNEQNYKTLFSDLKVLSCTGNISQDILVEYILINCEGFNKVSTISGSQDQFQILGLKHTTPIDLIFVAYSGNQLGMAHKNTSSSNSLTCSIAKYLKNSEVVVFECTPYAPEKVFIDYLSGISTILTSTHYSWCRFLREQTRFTQKGLEEEILNDLFNYKTDFHSKWILKNYTSAFQNTLLETNVTFLKKILSREIAKKNNDPYYAFKILLKGSISLDNYKRLNSQEISQLWNEFSDFWKKEELDSLSKMISKTIINKEIPFNIIKSLICLLGLIHFNRHLTTHHGLPAIQITRPYFLLLPLDLEKDLHNVFIYLLKKGNIEKLEGMINEISQPMYCEFEEPFPLQGIPCNDQIQLIIKECLNLNRPIILHFILKLVFRVPPENFSKNLWQQIFLIIPQVLSTIDSHQKNQFYNQLMTSSLFHFPLIHDKLKDYTVNQLGKSFEAITRSWISLLAISNDASVIPSCYHLWEKMKNKESTFSIKFFKNIVKITPSYGHRCLRIMRSHFSVIQLSDNEFIELLNILIECYVSKREPSLLNEFRSKSGDWIGYLEKHLENDSFDLYSVITLYLKLDSDTILSENQQNDLLRKIVIRYLKNDIPPVQPLSDIMVFIEKLLNDPENISLFWDQLSKEPLISREEKICQLLEISEKKLGTYANPKLEAKLIEYNHQWVTHQSFQMHYHKAYPQFTHQLFSYLCSAFHRGALSFPDHCWKELELIHPCLEGIDYSTYCLMICKILKPFSSYVETIQNQLLEFTKLHQTKIIESFDNNGQVSELSQFFFFLFNHQILLNDSKKYSWSAITYQLNQPNSDLNEDITKFNPVDILTKYNPICTKDDLITLFHHLFSYQQFSLLSPLLLHYASHFNTSLDQRYWDCVQSLERQFLSNKESSEIVILLKNLFEYPNTGDQLRKNWIFVLNNSPIESSGYYDLISSSVNHLLLSDSFPLLSSYVEKWLIYSVEHLLLSKELLAQFIKLLESFPQHQGDFWQLLWKKASLINLPSTYMNELWLFFIRDNALMTPQISSVSWLKALELLKKNPLKTIKIDSEKKAQLIGLFSSPECNLLFDDFRVLFFQMKCLELIKEGVDETTYHQMHSLREELTRNSVYPATEEKWSIEARLAIAAHCTLSKSQSVILHMVVNLSENYPFGECSKNTLCAEQHLTAMSDLVIAFIRLQQTDDDIPELLFSHISRIYTYPNIQISTLVKLLKELYSFESLFSHNLALLYIIFIEKQHKLTTEYKEPVLKILDFCSKFSEIPFSDKTIDLIATLLKNPLWTKNEQARLCHYEITNDYYYKKMETHEEPMWPHPTISKLIDYLPYLFSNIPLLKKSIDKISLIILELLNRDKKYFFSAYTQLFNIHNIPLASELEWVRSEYFECLLKSLMDLNFSSSEIWNFIDGYLQTERNKIKSLDLQKDKVAFNQWISLLEEVIYQNKFPFQKDLEGLKQNFLYKHFEFIVKLDTKKNYRYLIYEWWCVINYNNTDQISILFNQSFIVDSQTKEKIYYRILDKLLKIPCATSTYKALDIFYLLLKNHQYLEKNLTKHILKYAESFFINSIQLIVNGDTPLGHLAMINHPNKQIEFIKCDSELITKDPYLFFMPLKHHLSIESENILRERAGKILLFSKAILHCISNENGGGVLPSIYFKIYYASISLLLLNQKIEYGYEKVNLKDYLDDLLELLPFVVQVQMCDLPEASNTNLRVLTCKDLQRFFLAFLNYLQHKQCFFKFSNEDIKQVSKLHQIMFHHYAELPSTSSRSTRDNIFNNLLIILQHINASKFFNPTILGCTEALDLLLDKTLPLFNFEQRLVLQLFRCCFELKISPKEYLMDMNKFRKSWEQFLMSLIHKVNAAPNSNHPFFEGMNRDASIHSFARMVYHELMLTIDYPGSLAKEQCKNLIELLKVSEIKMPAIKFFIVPFYEALTKELAGPF